GAVYLAYDTRLEAQVAVKSNFNPAPESVEQFLQEARLLASLKHPNLPRVTDYFVIGKEQYLVMDFIPGDDLSKHLKTSGVQDLEKVLIWADHLCDALYYLHKQKPAVIHRDVKPANIKITPDGELYLVDFGIAKAAGAAQETASGAAGYTPGYAPPEQYGYGRTGPYSDQYSLAATIYALLATAKPADSIQRVMGKASLLPLSDFNPQIPVYVADAVIKALSLQPEDRFKSVAEFRKALANPDFRLSDDERSLLTSAASEQAALQTIPGGASIPTVLAGKKEGSKKGLLIGLGIGGAILGVILIVIVIGLFLFVLPGAPFTLGKVSTAVSAVQQNALVIPTTASSGSPTLSPTDIPPTAAMSEPTATEKALLIETMQPKLIGESGRIVFVSDRGDGSIQQLWTMRVTRNAAGEILTDNYEQLTFGSGNKDHPVWSPDGNQIAYTAPGDMGNDLDIWVMGADGGNPQNITNHKGDEFDPVWALDGSLIVFTCHSRTDGSRKIYQLFWVKPDGSERKRISEDFVESQATFSPDGKYLVFVISASSHNYLYIRSDFDDFTTPEKFDVRDIFGELGEVADPEFSPDGKQLVYTRMEGSSCRIVLITFSEVHRKGARDIQEFDVSTEESDMSPAWSADMRWLAFTSTRDGGDFEIYIMSTAGRPQINLTNRPGVDKSPDWKPIP
ncbi:MAG: protein kinase, partial [Chloroflexota bacterium]